MTTKQLHLFNILYLIFLVVVAVLTRATASASRAPWPARQSPGWPPWASSPSARRWDGGIWRSTGSRTSWCCCGSTSPCVRSSSSSPGASPAGWLAGLAVVAVVMAFVGPARDFWYMKRFPEWGAYAPGIAPVLAISATYVLLGVIGHGVMRLVAGPAREDKLARRPWEAV